MKPISALPWTLVDANIQFQRVQYCRIDGDGPFRAEQPADACFVFVASGEGVLIDNGGRYAVHRGIAGIVLKPWQVSLAAAHDGTISVYLLFFRLLQDADSTETLWLTELSKRTSGQISDRVKALYGSRMEAEELERFRHQIDFQELVYLLLKDVAYKRSIGHREALQLTARYIEQHYYEPLSRDKLAEMAGMSAPYYSRAFKKAMGKTPQEYWTGIRLNHARRALIQTSDKIGDIAEYTGFGEAYYFSRVFRQTIGVSPTVYQKQQRTKVACLYPPFIDAMLALGAMPSAYMMEPAHPLYARLTGSVHLGCQEADFNEREAAMLEAHQPEMILSSDYIDPHQETLLNRIAPVVAVNWARSREADLLEIARLIGKSDYAAELLADYEQRASQARERIKRRIGCETVALLRFHANQLRLYGGPGQGFAGPILYGDLALHAPELVQKLTWRSWWAQIEPALLAELDAEHLLIVIDPGMEGEAERLMGGELWSRMPASEKGQIYQVDYYTWMGSGIELDKLKIAEALRLLS